MIEWRDVAMALLTVAGVVLGWVARQMWEAIDQLRSDLQNLLKDLPEIYARRDDVREFFNQIMSELKEIRREVKEKADK